MNVNDYKEWYQEHYNQKPSDKLIKSFCLLNKIPWPPKQSEEEIIFYPPPKVNMLFGWEIEG
jgi:hypothetical protein